MKSFGKYISKYLASFAALILALALLNALAFGFVSYQVVTQDFGDAAPRKMLEEVAAALTEEGREGTARQKLKDNGIWAMFLDAEGNRTWAADVPKEFAHRYTLQDVALFSRGYLNDYPVFVRNTGDGLLVLGYPKNSYTKLTGNYLPIRAVQLLPLYITGMLAVDFLLLFLAYYFSKRKILRNTEPIITAVEALANGDPLTLAIGGELAEVADSVNRASRLLNRQNEARANWISGVSHDIRTPLSLVMGYAQRIADDAAASAVIREEAEIVRLQSLKIKELVQDLNLVSRLEYEMQPLRKEKLYPAKLLRSYAAQLLNTGLGEGYSLALEIASEAEETFLEGDERLIFRAVNNLVQNSIRHNPQGCRIELRLTCSETELFLIETDDGIGLSQDKLKELEEKPHYLESADERLDLRHGLGLVLVRQIAQAHGGAVTLENTAPHGCRATLRLPR